MKIPLIYIPKTRFKKFIYFEKKYFCNNEIIPIGCDCHPAYTLQKLNIRKRSLPLDWLNTDAVKGLEFVNENIANNFRDFLSGLYKNDRGHVVSKQFPYAEFMHEENLIESETDRAKFKRRIQKFLKLKHERAYYLYNVTSEALTSDKIVMEFYNSAVKFQSNLERKQLLCIYIRYDESYNENYTYCDKLLNSLKNTKKIKATKYLREREKEGIWGNEKKYSKLYRSLGIKIYLTFPKMFIK